MQKRVDGYCCCALKRINLPGNYAALSLGSDGDDGLGAV
jgi:hypothetical protein